MLLSSCGRDVPAITEDITTDITSTEPITDSGNAGADDTDAPSTTNAPSTTAPTTMPPIDTTGAGNEGRFEGDVCDIKVEYISGTKSAFVLEGHTLKFTEIKEDSVYAVSGKLNGNIVIDVVNDYKLDIELTGLSLISNSANPIVILSGDEVSLTAKKDTSNYVYDDRAAVEGDDAKKAAIYSDVDLEICGKGNLTVISQYNNGIHSKDDLQVKNLQLYVKSVDNSLKGNDSVELKECSTLLIATQGDTVKTSNSSISDKGNQKGNITVNGGNHTLYAACDGLDAAYDVIINEASTVINIYTDKYSEYSEEVTAVTENLLYIRFTNQNYNYSLKFLNDAGDYIWEDAKFHSKVGGGWSTTYYYYSLPKHEGYNKIQIYIFSSNSVQGENAEALATSDPISINTAYDTIALSARNNSMSYIWTNYTTQTQGNMGGRPGGPGGMGGPGGFGDGNSEKSDHSTKGIKANNEITINAGTINIKAYDDAIHANNDTTLENGEKPKGNVIINGGTLEIYSNDDGIHADNVLTVNGGCINVTNSYEGLEGLQVVINSGNISISAKDDGINTTTSSGTGVHIKGGYVYINCTGDGIDSNSRTSYSGIVFDGGNVVVISNSSMNSAIDTEQGYAFNGGQVLAIMPQGGMSSESTHCQSFSSIALNTNYSFSSGKVYTITDGGETILTFRSPITISGKAIYLGSKTAKIAAASNSDVQLDANGVLWH